MILIIARSLFSWFPGGPESRVGSMLVMLTEPILSPLRHLIMKFKFAQSSPIDFSPMVAVLLLFLIQTIIELL